MKERLLMTSRRLWLLVACGLLMMAVLLLGRVAFVAMFIPWEEISSHDGALPLMLFNIFRFDAQVAAYVLLLPTVFALVALLPVGRRYGGFVAAFNRLFFAIAALLLILLTAIDMGFYRNFGTHINLTFFDFFNEGPWGLLRAIWEEYNVMLYALLLVMGFVAVYFAVAFLEKKAVWHAVRASGSSASLSSKPVTPRWVLLSSAFLLLYIGGMVIAMRGSVWMYPLQEEDIYVSESKMVNDVVPNAAYMLKKAWKEKKNSFVIPSDDRLLSDYGFSNVQEALDTYTNGRVTLYEDTLAALHGALFEAVGDTLSHRQPNVVVVYAESWSNVMFRLDSPSFDVEQGMDRHFADDLLFTNIQSVQNGTVASIENIAVSTPYPRLFRSRYRLKVLPTSIALPFKDSGYDTEFISGMDMAWENCAEAMTCQQFDKVSDKYHLLAEDKSYAYNGIGIYDEHLLNSIYNRLQAGSDKPQMMLAITTTNHPPFDFPDGMNLTEIPDEVYDNAMFGVKDKAVLRKYIDGFRYLNSSLAVFLDRVKASPAADNTVIVITGDHNVRSVIDYNVVGSEWKHSVPLYVYLPPMLRKDVYKTMTSRYGSHDDILSTLAPMAFRNTKYYKMGNNLLSDTLQNTIFYSANVDQLLAADSLMTQAERRIKARDMLRHMYFRRIFEEEGR